MEKLRKLSERLQGDLQPQAAYAANHNMSPAHFYVSSILLSIVAGLLVAGGGSMHWPLLIVALILFLRLTCTQLGLILICEHRMHSKGNIFLAELHIPISEAFIYLPFAFIEGVSGPLVVLTVVAGILCQMVSIIAVPMISSRRHDGPITSTERLVVFVCICLLLGIGLPAFLWVNLVLFTLLIMQVITFINRIKKSLDQAA